MSLKDTRIIDLNLFLNSSELLRQAIGGYYYVSDTNILEFSQADFNSLVQVEKTEPTLIDDNTDFLLPKIKFATRIFVDDANANIVSDEEWRKFIIGGTFSDKNYSGIYNENVYSDHYNTSSLPLKAREIINTDIVYPGLSLTTEYYNYYKRFQAEVGSLESELLAPNYYYLSSSFLQSSQNTNSTVGQYSYPELAEFLTDSYVNDQKLYESKLENIIIVDPENFNDYSTTNKDTDLLTTFTDSDLQKVYSLMPFGNKLEIDLGLTGDTIMPSEYRDIIETHDYEIKFVKLLKEVFQGESPLQTSTVNFAVNTDATISNESGFSDVSSIETLPFKIVDVPTLLMYAYRNPESETSNISIVGSHDVNSANYSRQYLDYEFDTTGSLRYKNTEASLDVLNGFLTKIKEQFDNDSTRMENVESFLSLADKPKVFETVAFRIEKIGGQPTGDSNTQNTIQNIWFYNYKQAITYLDTQVKYDTEYTYKIYKYDIVQGYKYQLSGIVTTRKLALENSGDEDVYCLEFYDPFTGQTSNNLLDTGNALGPVEARKAVLDDRLAGLNTLLSLVSTGALKAEFAELLQTFLDQVGGGTAIKRTTLYTDSNTLQGNNPYWWKVYGSEYLDNEIVAFPYYIRNMTYPGLPLENIDSFLYSTPTFGRDTISGGLRYTGDSTQGNILFFDFSSSDVVEEIRIFKEQLESEAQVLSDILQAARPTVVELEEELSYINSLLDLDNTLTTNAQINSSYPYLADFNISIEPSVKIVEIPLEEKRMRIVDHPPNDLVITPHHLLDQSNRLAFYCKYDTFSMNTVTYPPTLTEQDEQNKNAYLTGHDFLNISKQTQESISQARFIQVYRTSTKPSSYSDFTGNLRKSIDLRPVSQDGYQTFDLSKSLQS